MSWRANELTDRRKDKQKHGIDSITSTADAGGKKKKKTRVSVGLAVAVPLQGGRTPLGVLITEPRPDTGQLAT